jgi:hypothetical protein
MENIVTLPCYKKIITNTLSTHKSMYFTKKKPPLAGGGFFLKVQD